MPINASTLAAGTVGQAMTHTFSTTAKDRIRNVTALLIAIAFIAPAVAEETPVKSWLLRNGALYLVTPDPGPIGGIVVKCEARLPTVFIVIRLPVRKPELVLEGPDDERVVGEFYNNIEFAHPSIKLRGRASYHFLRFFIEPPQGWKPSHGAITMGMSANGSATIQNFAAAGAREGFYRGLGSCKGRQDFARTAAAATAPIAPSGSCLPWNARMTVTGRLSKEKFKLPGGPTETVPVIAPDLPACFQKGADEFEPALGPQRRMQVTTGGGIRLPYGKIVTVIGTPFLGHSAHHHTETVLGDVEVNAAPTAGPMDW